MRAGRPRVAFGVAALWLGSLAGLLLLACAQTVDPGAAAGSNQPPPAPAAPAPMVPAAPGGPPTPGNMPAPPPVMPPPPSGSPVMAVNCDPIRREARRVLETNCAPCHQAPANQANFSFCLEVDRLATAISSTGKRFVVSGSPEQSRLYERVANGEMPPAVVAQRPSREDVTSLHQWITSCVELGKGGFGNLDAGVPDASPEPDPGPGCGKPRQPCCLANTCESGGCCVLGFCRASGQSCPGGPGGDNIPGTCMAGSCVTSGIGCGAVGQACCGVVRSCTAPRALCPGGMMTCQPCGQMGGPCCKNGGLSTCLEGLDCVGDAYPNPGRCEPCGASGQPCCGDGPAARRKCNAALTCQFRGGTSFLCQPPSRADAGTGPDTARLSTIR